MKPKKKVSDFQFKSACIFDNVGISVKNEECTSGDRGLKERCEEV
jgi:hypothetical protein